MQHHGITGEQQDPLHHSVPIWLPCNAAISLQALGDGPRGGRWYGAQSTSVTPYNCVLTMRRFAGPWDVAELCRKGCLPVLAGAVLGYKGAQRR